MNRQERVDCPVCGVLAAIQGGKLRQHICPDEKIAHPRTGLCPAVGATVEAAEEVCDLLIDATRLVPA
jgi:hypothetical protein